jgi:hypothetical protein
MPADLYDLLPDAREALRSFLRSVTHGEALREYQLRTCRVVRADFERAQPRGPREQALVSETLCALALVIRCLETHEPLTDEQTERLREAYRGLLAATQPGRWA